jgi:hypothetical protein
LPFRVYVWYVPAKGEVALIVNSYRDVRSVDSEEV